MEIRNAITTESPPEVVAAYASSMTTTEREARIRARLDAVPEMTPEQRRQQRESFAYGNVKLDEPHVTRPPSTKP